jgi:hypothetical protein
MTDYRTLYSKDYVAAYDLGGKDVTVTITKVIAGDLTDNKGKKTKKPLVYFEGAEKALVLNATNGKTIAGMYGNICEDWIGKRITMFPTTTDVGGETKECIRVRPKIPATPAPAESK